MNWIDSIKEAATAGRRIWSSEPEHQTRALAQFIRPNLGPTPTPLRQVLEPVVGACAALAIAVLIGVGITSLSAFLLAAALIYAIMTYVFGIQLDLAPLASAQ